MSMIHQNRFGRIRTLTSRMSEDPASSWIELARWIPIGLAWSFFTTSCELSFQLTAFKKRLQFRKSQGYGKTGYKNVQLVLQQKCCAFCHPQISKPGSQQIRLLQKVQSSIFYFLKENIVLAFSQPQGKLVLWRYARVWSNSRVILSNRKSVSACSTQLTETWFVARQVWVVSSKMHNIA